MSEVKDLTGQTFGRLTVIRRVAKPADLRVRVAYWECRCECGTLMTAVSGFNLRQGHTQSCGCLIRDSQRSSGRQWIGETNGALTIVAHSPRKTRNRFCHLLAKCVCEEIIEVSKRSWQKGCPASCATCGIRSVKYARFRRDANSQPICVDGQFFPSLKEAAKFYDISYRTAVDRLHHGWTPERAFKTPVIKKGVPF